MAKGISLKKMISQTKQRFAVPMVISLPTTTAAVLKGV